MEAILAISDLPGWVALLSLFSFFSFACSASLSHSLNHFFVPHHTRCIGLIMEIDYITEKIPQLQVRRRVNGRR